MGDLRSFDHWLLVPLARCLSIKSVLSFTTTCFIQWIGLVARQASRPKFASVTLSSLSPSLFPRPSPSSQFWSLPHPLFLLEKHKMSGGPCTPEVRNCLCLKVFDMKAGPHLWFPSVVFPQSVFLFLFLNVWFKREMDLFQNPVFLKTILLHSLLPQRVARQAGKAVTAKVWSAYSYMIVKSFSHIWLFVTPWTVACQTPLSMRFSRQEYWGGLPFPTLGDLPDPGMEPRSPALQADSLLTEPPGSPTELHTSTHSSWKHAPGY